MWLTAILVAIALGLLALAVERLAVRRAVRAGDGHGWLIATLGVGFVIQGVAQLEWGSDPRSVELPGDRSFEIASGVVTVSMVVVVVFTAILAAALEFVRRRTVLGARFLATAEDPTAAELCGINTRRVGQVAWAVSGVVGGISGVVLAPLTLASVSLGPLLVVYGFLAMAFAGFGSLAGAVLGGIAVGVAQNLIGYYLGVTYQDVLLYGVLALLLLVLPAGLNGPRALREV
jgi:branched-chain amino acid transport system permease protein